MASGGWQKMSIVVEMFAARDGQGNFKFEISDLRERRRQGDVIGLKAAKTPER
jgi:hypothetical protein